MQLVHGAYKPVKQEFDRQFQRFAYVYADFTSEETKRKWKWSRQMAQEAKLWRSIVTFTQGEFPMLLLAGWLGCIAFNMCCAALMLPALAL